VIDVPGRLFPLEITYRAGVEIDEAVLSLLPRVQGAILCFLPGAPEIGRAIERLRLKLPPGVAVLPLHGSLAADEQDAALEPSGETRVIVATNLAETTLTVPDVDGVVDTGLHKIARYDATRGIDSLATERIAQDSADQRAGRAGRVRAGVAVRLWDSRDRLRAHREPEIARIDLASTALDVLAWGGDPLAIEWFQTPPAGSLQSAMDLLGRLGAIDSTNVLTDLGRVLGRMPLHPRLARMLVAAHGDGQMARACALLSERRPPARSRGFNATNCDLLAAVETDQDLPPPVRRAAREIERIAAAVLGQRNRPSAPVNEEAFRRAVLAGYPDRIARRRSGSNDRFVLASGTGARLARESGVVNAEFVVAIEVTEANTVGGEALIRLATRIERDWIAPTSARFVHEFDSAAGAVRAFRVEMYDSLVLSEMPAAPDPQEAGKLIAREALRRGPSDTDQALMRRLQFAGVVMDFKELIGRSAAGKTRLSDLRLEDALTGEARRALARQAPATLTVPSGREVRLEYRDGGVVAAAVKLQELFGLADSPRLGVERVPVTFELLSPAGRPVQVTSDLRSFWTRGYPEVRKELRPRYPKHPWPDDPWTAQPTARPIGRKPR
jgi:ATP-dependent helicase HrpB